MTVGFITGTGFYQLPGLSDPKLEAVETPYGTVEATRGHWHDGEVAFLPRHGPSHTIAPSKINYRANIWALSSLGVTELFTVAVVGSLHEKLAPGRLVLVDQFIDLTKGKRPDTFFDEGELRHADMTFPYSARLRELLVQIATERSVPLVPSGTYACFEGPRFETAAEATMAARLGGDVVGMTAYPEVALARELDIEICTVAVVSNYAPGVVGNTVSIEEVTAETASASAVLFTLLGRAVELLTRREGRGS